MFRSSTFCMCSLKRKKKSDMPENVPCSAGSPFPPLLQLPFPHPWQKNTTPLTIPKSISRYTAPRREKKNPVEIIKGTIGNNNVGCLTPKPG